MTTTNHRSMVLLLASALAAAAGAQTRWNPTIAPIGAKNLLPNSSFECGPAGWSSVGKGTAWGGDLCGLFGEVVSGGAFDGDNCLRIELGPGLTPQTSFDWPPPQYTVTQSAPLAANLGWIDAAVGRCYVASACMRADRPGVKAKIAVRIGGFTHAQWPRIEEQSTTVTLSEEWERYSLVARVNEPDVYVAVGPDLTATPDAAATVWIDAVQFEQLDVDDEPQALTEGFEDGTLVGMWELTAPEGWGCGIDNATISGGVVRLHNSADSGKASAVVASADNDGLVGDFTLEFAVPDMADFADDDGVWVGARYVVTDPNWTEVSYPVIGRLSGEYVVREHFGGSVYATYDIATTKSISLHAAVTAGLATYSASVNRGPFSEIGSLEWDEVADTTPVQVYLCAQDWISAVQGPFDVAVDDLIVTAHNIPPQGLVATEFARREPIEIGLDTECFGNVFEDGAPVTINVRGSNTTDAPARVQVSAEIEDYFGNPLPESSIALDVPARSTVSEHLALNTSGVGHYRATLSWEAEDVQHSQAIVLAVIRPYQWDDSPFGVNHAPPTTSLCEQLQKAGVTWARDWSMRWDALEPVKGDLSFALSDGQINWVARTGMKQMALMPPFPSSEWASEAPENLRELVPDKPPRIRQAYAPRDPQDLCAFIDQAVRHCQGRIGVYEFLNEPVFTYYGLPTSIYGLPGAEYTPMDYLELLRPAYATMKAADPDCLVSGGFGAPTMLYAREFVEAGGLDHLDIYNLHTYAELSAPERFVEGLATLQNLMDASDAGRKPLWITECGCYASDDKPWTPWAVPEGHWAGPLQVSDEKQAAAYSVRHAAILMACGAEKFFYHMGCDGEVNNGSQELANPLLGPLGEPKKFYVALSVMANSLGPNPVYAAHLDKPSSIDGLSTFDVHGYAFQCDERAVLIAWKAASRFEWAIDVPEDAVACNIIGAPLTTGKAQLGESPIYVTTESMTAQELAGACALSSTYAGNGEGNSAAQEHVERFDDGSPDGIWGIGWTGWCTGGEGDIAIKDGVCRFINDSATDGYMTAHINNLQHPLAPYFTLEFSIPRLSELPDHGAAITTRYLVAEATEATEQPGLRVGKVGDFCIIERSTGGALISYPASSATSVSVRQTVRPDGVTVACSIDGGGFTELGATIPWEGVDATDEISIIVQANDLTGMDRGPVLSIPSRGPFDIAIDNLVLTHSR